MCVSYGASIFMYVTLFMYGEVLCPKFDVQLAKLHDFPAHIVAICISQKRVVNENNCKFNLNIDFCTHTIRAAFENKKYGHWNKMSLSMTITTLSQKEIFFVVRWMQKENNYTHRKVEFEHDYYNHIIFITTIIRLL